MSQAAHKMCSGTNTIRRAVSVHVSIGRHRALWLALGVALVAASCSLFAADTDNFASQSLPQDGKVLTVTSANYDDKDGAELIVFSADDRGQRHLKIFTANPAGLYDTIPKANFELPTGVFGYQIVDFDSDRRDELLLLGLEAAYLLDFDKGGYVSGLKPIASFERLFGIPDPNFVIEYKFAFDLNGDGIFELILPSWNGVRLLQKKDNGFAAAKQMALTYKADGVNDVNVLNCSGNSEVGFRLPIITVMDLNTDRSPDLLVETTAGLAIFYQTGNMQFADRPNRFLEVKPSYQQNLFFSASGLADLNRDRLLDYCRVFTQSSGDEFKTVIEIFFGNVQEGFSSRPSKRIVLDQFGAGLSLKDLDNDGTASIIIATLPVTPTSLVKALLVKGIPVELNVFEVDGGVIADQPVTVKRVSCGLSFFQDRIPAKYLGCVDGDLEGDRFNDLVVVTDDEELQVFPGGRRPLFSDKPSIVRKAKGVISVEARRLNGDTKADLILQGRDEDGRETVTLLITK